MPATFLADENVPGDTIRLLRESGFDVRTVTSDSPGAQDESILARAQAERRVVITLDKDFGGLAFKHGLSAESGVILIRVPLSSPSAVSTIVLQALKTRDDWAGNFSVIEEDRVRMTALP